MKYGTESRLYPLNVWSSGRVNTESAPISQNEIPVITSATIAPATEPSSSFLRPKHSTVNIGIMVTTKFKAAKNYMIKILSNMELDQLDL